MKKLLSLALVLAMVLSFSVAAFADDPVINKGDRVDNAAIAPGGTFKLTKEYQVSGGTAPAEIFEFTATASEDNPTVTGFVDELTVSKADFKTNYANGVTASTSTKLTVTLPEYKKVGTYEYTVRETPSENAGVETADPIIISVQVVNKIDPDTGRILTKDEGGGLECYVNVYRTVTVNDVVTKIEDEKTEGFVDDSDTYIATENDDKNNANKYNAGTLNISKTVAGAQGDTSEYFEFTVTLTGDSSKIYQGFKVKNASTKTSSKNAEGNTTYTYTKSADGIAMTDNRDGTYSLTFYLKHGDTASIENIPYDMTYTVSETTPTGYTCTHEITDDTEEAEGAPEETTIDSDEETYAVTNTWNEQIKTGISLDTIPYIALLAVATLGLAVVLTKKRGSEE